MGGNLKEKKGDARWSCSPNLGGGAYKEIKMYH